MSTTLDPNLQLARIRGCILGGALGDAIGLFTEFLTRKKALEIYPPHPPSTLPHLILAASESLNPPGTHTIYEDSHRAIFEVGGWTDDTDQSLLILLSFLRSYTTSTPGILDQNDFAARLREWVAFGLRVLDHLQVDVGMTVSSVVGGAGYLDDPVGVAKVHWERSGCNAAANGAVMRTAVIGCLLFQDSDGISGIERSMSSAVAIAATTHADPRCLISCAIVSGAVAAMISSSSPFTLKSLEAIVSAAKSLLSKHDPPLSDAHLKELDQVLWVKNIEDLELGGSRSIGYTYKCLGAGIWVLRQAISEPISTVPARAGLFERLITELTMQAGDADTNCAVAGSLLGCFLTSTGLPQHWTGSLAHSDWLIQKSDAVASVLSIYPKTPSDMLSPPPSYGPENPYVPHLDADTLLDAGKSPMRKEELNRKWEILFESMDARIAGEKRHM